MPALKLQVSMKERNPGLLGRGMTNRLDLLVRNERQAREQAAAVATNVTQASFTYKRPADAARRRGRSFTTGGRFPSFLEWTVTADRVAFDARKANSRVPYWIIQEIGTGQSARIRKAGETVQRGRPTREEASVRSPRIPSQVGRLIPANLAFGTAEGGNFTPAGAARGQQLYLRSRLKGAPVQRDRALVITREIEGQHFVQKGGQAGFRQYRTSVLAAARQAFAGHRFSP